MMHLMFKASCFLFCFMILKSPAAHSTPVIYIIRHAEVDTRVRGWCSSKEANGFRIRYNKADIREFDPESVLKKIKNPDEADTVFCSPQQRAIQTAHKLFTDSVILNINDNLMEFQYPVVKWPLVRMPARAWLTISLILWMAGNDNETLPGYRERKKDLESYSIELIEHAERNGKCIVVAHGVVNRELIRILRRKGWKYDRKEGYGNLSVNSLKR